MFSDYRYYYLHNFRRALDWLGERNGDLLDEVELRFLTQFPRLPQVSQALMVRMLMRRGPWFRATKLLYPEIPSAAEAAAPLLELGWIDAQHHLELDELFTLHTKQELLRLFTAMPVHAGMRKTEILQTLQTMHAGPRSYALWNPLAHEAIWRVMVRDLCERLRLMFFGNLHQDWSEFVLADLGIFKYEAVEFDVTSRAFQSRADVDVYLALQACRHALEAGDDTETVLIAVEKCASSNPWLHMRRTKLLLRIGQACERTQDWSRAEHAYAQSDYPGARYRRMRVYERTRHFAEAMSLALTAESAPESDEESQRVARMLPRLRRRLGESSPRLARLSPAVVQMRIDLALCPPDIPTPVEYVVRDHWHSEATPVFYVENALINSLFGLLCWPAVFEPLPGAFFHPFQSGPADLTAPDFARRRAAAFEACLTCLDDGSYRDTVRQRFADKQGVQSPFVSWGALTENLLELALHCIPAAHLKLLFRRLLHDVHANRTGFPDLVRFWPSERRYALVEIKAPGDRLQDNQIRWLAYCAGHDIPVSVCHVQWRDAALATEGVA